MSESNVLDRIIILIIVVMDYLPQIALSLVQRVERSGSCLYGSAAQIKPPGRHVTFNCFLKCTEAFVTVRTNRVVGYVSSSLQSGS